MPAPVVAGLVQAGRAAAVGTARAARAGVTVGGRVVKGGAAVGRAAARAGRSASRTTARGTRQLGRGAEAGARAATGAGRAGARSGGRLGRSGRAAGPAPRGLGRPPGRRPDGPGRVQGTTGPGRGGPGHGPTSGPGRGEQGRGRGRSSVDPRRRMPRRLRDTLRRRSGDGEGGGDDRSRRGRRGRRGIASRAAGALGQARTTGRQQLGEAWHGGGVESMSPLAGAGRPGAGGRWARRAERGAYAGLRVGRRIVGAPFWLLHRLSPRRQVEKLRRRLRRVLLLAVVLLFLVFAVPAALIVPDEGGLSAVSPGLLAGVAAEPAAIGAVDGRGVGSVGGIPYADVFNRVVGLGVDPRLVAAVAWVESGGFAGDVVSCERDSPSGARGIMQLMPGTAAELGVDPCDPEQAIPAGARYLQQQYERFGDWELAIAAYNVGPAAVEACTCIPQNGETEAYVPEVMAQWERFEEMFPGSELAGEPGPAGVAPRGGTEPYPASSCASGQVPTTANPCITPTMRHAVDATIAAFGRGHGVGCSRPGDPEDHGKGRACDFMVATGGRRPTPEMRAHGQAMADWLVANAESLGVQYVIWEQRIWNISRAAEGWRPMADRGSVTQNHYDHVHLSVRP